MRSASCHPPPCGRVCVISRCAARAGAYKLHPRLIQINESVKPPANRFARSEGIQGMPSSAVRTFTDPDDYAASIRRSTNEVTIIGRGQFAAKLTRIDLHGLWMQRLSDNLPRILHCASETGRSAITFRTHPGPSLAWSGKEMHPSNIRRHAEGGAAFQHASGSASFAAMSLPVEEMALLGATIGRCDLAP